MREIKLTLQTPMTFVGPNIEELKAEAARYINDLCKAGKRVTYTNMYAVVVIPVELDTTENKTGGRRKAVIANDTITL